LALDQVANDVFDCQVCLLDVSGVGVGNPDGHIGQIGERTAGTRQRDHF